VNFEKRVQRLEEIVRALESREMTLDKGLRLFEEGIACLRDASEELARAEAAVQVLRERTDGIIEARDLRA
jgi:exodeoxyribonuclease VII small subunit